MSDKIPYTVWWFEIDARTKELKRVHRDFANRNDALQFQHAKQRAEGIDGRWLYMKATTALAWHRNRTISDTRRVESHCDSCDALMSKRETRTPE